MPIPMTVPVDSKHEDESYESPSRAAAIAHANQRGATKRLKDAKKLRNKFGHNDTSSMLVRVLERQSEAHTLLATIGYDTLRHLQAAGITIAEIAHDLDMNMLDLMAYMSSHPQAEEHAEIDAVCCADMKMREFVASVQQASPITKFEADRMKVMLQATEMLCARISSKWASQMKADTANLNINANVGMTFNMDMSGDLSALPSRNRKQHEDVIEAEVVPVVETVDEFQDPLALETKT